MRDKKREGQKREGRVGEIKMEEGEWGGETGHRLHPQRAGKRGGRDDKAGSRLHPVQLGVKPGMTKWSIAPKDNTPTGRFHR